MTTDWMADAACAGMPDNLFYPPDTTGNYRGFSFDYSHAERICLGCPVRLQCLDYALDREALDGNALCYGMWGGVRPADRADMLAKGERRKRQRLHQQARDADQHARLAQLTARGHTLEEAGRVLGLTRQQAEALQQRRRRDASPATCPLCGAPKSPSRDTCRACGDTCVNGHTYTPETIGTQGRCRVCAREYEQRRRAAKGGAA